MQLGDVVGPGRGDGMSMSVKDNNVNERWTENDEFADDSDSSVSSSDSD